MATETHEHRERHNKPSASGREDLLDRLARKIVDRGLSAPAVIFLESTKPLNFVGCQALNFLEPMVQSVFSIKSYNEFTQLMENRSNIENLILKIEELEEERTQERKSKVSSPDA
ncbi:MAG: hypothetical protein JSV84_12200 [Gemmatimonadota bacterium]|nr:MAG: hypothetical protein JSV84_12200 [Gemmatimonadota bacterium]